MAAKKNRPKNRVGIVYSTNDEYEYRYGEEQIENTLPPSEQKLTVSLDRKNRKGKSVTLVEGFKGTETDLKLLGKELKTACGSGGSVKEGIVIIQGDFRNRIKELLTKKGFRVKG